MGTANRRISLEKVMFERPHAGTALNPKRNYVDHILLVTVCLRNNATLKFVVKNGLVEKWSVTFRKVEVICRTDC